MSPFQKPRSLAVNLVRNGLVGNCQEVDDAPERREVRVSKRLTAREAGAKDWSIGAVGDRSVTYESSPARADRVSDQVPEEWAACRHC